MNCLLVFSLIFLALAEGSGTIDMITGQKVKKQWLSFGVSLLNTVHWVSLQSETSFSAAGPSSTVVLLSLPELGGSLATEGVPTATRIRNVAYDSNNGRVSFQAKVLSSFAGTTLPYVLYVYHRSMFPMTRSV